MTRRPGVLAAGLTALVGALCLLLQDTAPFLFAFPKTWTIPTTDWVGSVLETILGAIKPAMRWFSWLIAYPMDGLNAMLNGLPWPVLIGAVTALGWHLGGLRLALLGLAGFGFVLLSGYWSESMNTLALVAVSVPLAMIFGGTIGILANEAPRLRNPLLGVLDAMQTIPTFAYLTPLLLLFGFGPVVGLVASAIYAAPPMARNMLLGLERIDSEVKEAAIMSGATRAQQLFQVEIPTARHQIMVGVNQCLMAALSMVIIAAVIGGFDDIGWEVLLTMRKAQFGQALLAGLVIVLFAIVIDRLSAAMARDRKRFKPLISFVIFGIGLVAGAALYLTANTTPPTGLLGPVAEMVDEWLSRFTVVNATLMDDIKNTSMFYGLLPLRIGLDDAVLPFTWGFQWTKAMSLVLFGISALTCTALIWLGKPVVGLLFLIGMGLLETGITNLPWPFFLTAIGSLAWVASGRKLAILSVCLLVTILVSGLWERALLSLYLSGAAVLTCTAFGGVLGVVSANSTVVWRLLRPVCDLLQTIPLFVFLIPVLMFFQIGEFSAFLAICAYAIVPMIRYTRQGIVTTPPEMIEAATANGATTWQILRDIRLPYAAPSILLGLNQTILYAFAMLVIAALVGTTGLGQSIYLALGQADVGLGVSAGAAMAILAFIADRLVQSFAEDRRKALGL
jgi:glycine betaine/proline transport system permease protein